MKLTRIELEFLEYLINRLNKEIPLESKTMSDISLSINNLYQELTPRNKA